MTQTKQSCREEYFAKIFLCIELPGKGLCIEFPGSCLNPEGGKK